MFVDVHAIVLLATVIVPAIAIARDPSWRPRPLRKAVRPALAIGALGVLCLSLLLANGNPIAEWLFPGIGALLAGLIVRSPRVFNIMGMALLVTAVGLCFNFLLLVTTAGYTAAPQRARQSYQARENALLQSSAKALRNALPAGEVLPAGPLAKILAQSDRGPGQAADLQTHWDREEIHTLWHTWYTHLYKIRMVPGEIWYPGGPVASASAKLQWKKSS